MGDKLPVKIITWVNQARSNVSPSLKELMIKQYVERNRLKWKAEYFALRYSTVPPRPSTNLSLAAIASGRISGGTHRKDKQNGKQSERK